MSKNIKTLKFNSEIFDCVIVLGGHFSETEIFEQIPNATIIAADSGYHNLGAYQKLAHVLIGDLDSHTADELLQIHPNIEIVQISEQETNDFEKAVHYAIKQGKKNLLIVGMNGGHLEHTLNNWSVFAKLSKKVNLVFYENGRYAFSIYSKVQLETTKSELISLIPQPKSILSSKGLKWELNNYTLTLGCVEGARNVALGNSIELDIHFGEILLFIDSKLPYAINIIDID